MLNSIFGTLSGKMANERKLDIISNNLSNALTPGFKAIDPAFTSTTIDDTVAPDQVPSEYVNIPDTYIRFSDAPLVHTGNSLDLAVEGNGFFAVSTPGGTMYTRSGQFTLDSANRIVTHDNNPVLGQSGGEIVIPTGGMDVRVESDGSIYVDKLFLDRLRVADFDNRNDLRNAGGNLFVNANSKNNEVPAENFSVHQGFYEASNVDVMKSMVQMIGVMRAYESYTRVDQSASDMLGKLIELAKF